MESPSLLLLDPTCEKAQEIKCVGDFYKLSKADGRKLSLAKLVSEIAYFVIEGNHRWVQKRDHLKLNPSGKNSFFYKFTSLHRHKSTSDLRNCKLGTTDFISYKNKFLPNDEIRCRYLAASQNEADKVTEDDKPSTKIKVKYITCILYYANN